VQLGVKLLPGAEGPGEGEGFGDLRFIEKSLNWMSSYFVRHTFSHRLTALKNGENFHLNNFSSSAIWHCYDRLLLITENIILVLTIRCLLVC